MKYKFLAGLILCVCVVGCQKKSDTLFRLLSSDESQVYFNNAIAESDTFNILTYEYIYNGGGVAIADFNNDSIPDIFFTGNQVSNRLYLGMGNLKYEDVTDKSGLTTLNRWSSGVSVVDINNDGWLDLHVCATAQPDPALRKDMLFINKGVSTGGVPVFEDAAASYGLDFNGHSISSAFFDYDNDGDLDLYVLVNVKLNNVPTTFRAKIEDGTSANNDRLFRNDGNGKFTDVTLEAGIVYEGYGLGLAIQDFNGDGWPDIYVSNDYLSNDILYINQKNGKFLNETSKFLGHQSQFSMGNDAADVNNDGLADLVTLDMLPENSERKKTTIGNKSYQNNINNETFNYQYQYVRNMLQLNGGSKFSEIGQLAGVSQTEWSWSPLFADYDNDGLKDLTITNGFPKDITDKDFANFRARVINIAPPSYMVDSIPVVKIPNYAFKNNGDLTFTDVSTKWGLNQPSFSNGSAFADLDNDGDLDYVVNNINSTAFIYENTLISKKPSKIEPSNFLRIKLIGSEVNRQGIGSKLYVYANGKMQYYEHHLSRGFLSSVDNTIHFGLGNEAEIDSLVIIWPDNKTQLLKSLKANTGLSLWYSNATSIKPFIGESNKPFVRNIAKEVGISYLHRQNDIIDFNIQRTIPHKFSQSGPALAVGDINGDGLEDLYISGATGYPGQFLVQTNNGTFQAGPTITASNTLNEERAALLFDFDQDGDLDLYIGVSGFEPLPGGVYTNKLYINDGKGNFKVESTLPATNLATACIRAADYNKDGKLDVFVGGRIIPGQYPTPPRNYLLKNEKNGFVDATEADSPELQTLGLVSDAIWTDFDNDGWIDLIVVGELMPVTFFKNENGKLRPFKTDTDKYIGWWSSIVGSDFDGDGDTDYVVGNYGLNNSYHVSSETPMRVFAKDLDNNGSIEALIFCYSKTLDGTEKLCPAHFWDELNQQSPRFRRQFSKYKNFSTATWETLLTEAEKRDAYIVDVNHLSSSYLENLGNGNFRLHDLPVEAQFAPTTGVVVSDVNNDGFTDVVIIGNDFGNEVFIGRHDAQTGLILLGDGTGNFKSITSINSGFSVPYNAKALVNLMAGNRDIFIASQNGDSLMVFETLNKNENRVFKPEPTDAWAILSFKDGKQQKVEFYYGSGYLSQSSRKWKVPKDAMELKVFNFLGESRIIKINGPL
ncbi:MAG: VCBS repeat-containing protein [Cytophagales bacterium]|nr:VCBS repeat-containing protein [Cytophagales bacterium]